MRKNKRGFRLAMLGLLCGGLLLAGVGAGICFMEVSSFTYGGRQLLEQAHTQGQILQVELPEDGGLLRVTSYDGQMLSQLRELGKIKTSETVAPGTAEIHLTYASVGMEASYFWEDGDTGREVSLYWHAPGRGVAVLMAYKDQVLEDLRERRFCDHIDAELTGAELWVHPDDMDRVDLE